jgi:hypothetical protein
VELEGEAAASVRWRRSRSMRSAWMSRRMSRLFWELAREALALDAEVGHEAWEDLGTGITRGAAGGGARLAQVADKAAKINRMLFSSIHEGFS